MFSLEIGKGLFKLQTSDTLIEKEADFHRERQGKFIDCVDPQRYGSASDLIIVINDIKMYFFENNDNETLKFNANRTTDEVKSLLSIISKLEIFTYDKLYPFEIEPLFNITFLKNELEKHT